jgi:hypothetical protein
MAYGYCNTEKQTNEKDNNNIDGPIKFVVGTGLNQFVANII